jgi:hypothetical protein
MYIFLHIPKSAGTTLRTVIEDQYTTRWSRVSAYKDDIPSPRWAAEEVLRRSPKQQDAAQILYGHFPYGSHPYLPSPASYYTILREPVDRVISHYYYVLHKFLLPDKSHPDRQRFLDGELTLEYYVSSGYCREMDNCQTRLLAGEAGLYENTPFGHCSQALLEEAKRNLRENIVLAGLTEQFDATLVLLQRLCGWRTPYYIRQNVTASRPHRSELAPDTLAVIEEWNRLDLQLYEYGVGLFQERVAQQEPSFAADVRAFQERNRRWGRLVLQYRRLTRRLAA